MGLEDHKAIDPNRTQAAPKDGPVAAVNGAIVEVRATASRHLGELMQRLWAIVDDQLFNLSGQAGNPSLESDYFLAMRLIRRESNALRANYEAAVLRLYDEFWKPRPKREGLRSGVPDADGSQLSLVAEEVLEEQLAVSVIIEKAKSLFQRELYTLDKRFAHLSGREQIEADDNPLGPSALCHAFAEALKPLPLHLAVKLLIYKLFEQVALRAFGSLYGELNAYLIRAGVLPQLSWSLKRNHMPGTVPAAAPGALPTGSDPAMAWTGDGRDESQQAYIEIFESMQSLLDGWRSRMGFGPAAPLNFAGPAVATSEVLNVLGVLQNVSMLDAALGPDNLKGYVRQQIRRLQPGESERPLARREEDIIDMVSLVFDFILEDVNLPDPVKTLIARLQIPVIKVAILERSFFGRKNHPARLLLNALAQAGIGLDMEDGGRENPVFKYIEAIVNRVQDEFGQDVNLFSELLDEFTAFVEKESQRTRIAEERTLQATHSKERVRLCKRKVAYEIAFRLQGKPVAAPVRSFLFNTWKDVMVLAYLRRDRSPDDWGQSLAIMDRLIWTMSVPIEPAVRNELIQAVPPLLKAIKEGLEALSLDPQAVAETLGDLQACQSARLFAVDAGWSWNGEANRTAAAEERQQVEIRDPELAQAIVEIRGSLPDVENLSLTDLAGPLSGTADDPGDPIPDEVLSKAHALATGQWVEFIENGKRVRAKLSWKSQTTSTHVFVNRKGVKVMELSLAELAGRFAKGTARIVEGATVPLMDRALDALINTLKGTIPESVPTTAG
jgi:hypothetical protein